VPSVRSLKRRIRQLEGGTGGECPECGFDGDWSEVRFRIEPGRGKGNSERCETCGRLTHIVLSWGAKV
jgi:hypothetical protein